MMREKTSQNFFAQPAETGDGDLLAYVSTVRDRLYAWDIEVGAVCALYSLRVEIYTVSASNDGFTP
jgi:hypothetical protein